MRCDLSPSRVQDAGGGAVLLSAQRVLFYFFKVQSCTEVSVKKMQVTSIVIYLANKKEESILQSSEMGEICRFC